MRKAALLAVAVAALVAATVAYAARGGSRAAAGHELADAAARSEAAASRRFQLTVHVEGAGPVPQTLHVDGAEGAAARNVHLKVDDVVLPDGRRLTGPFADEKVDGRFLYLRSSATQPMFGALWVRERLSALGAGSAELQTLRSVSPSALLQALPRAAGVEPGAQAGVFHARLPYRDAIVRRALAGVEGGVEYRDLRTTAWVGRDGYLRLLLVTGRTPDGAATLVLTLSLAGYGHRVAVTPPAAGRFVDFDLAQLKA